MVRGAGNHGGWRLVIEVESSNLPGGEVVVLTHRLEDHPVSIAEPRGKVSVSVAG
jgi:hypothetical protein